jgi:CRISPR-associated protein Cas1
MVATKVSVEEALAGHAGVLVVNEPGLFVGKHSERVIVRRKQEVLVETPLLALEQVIILGNGISFSSDLVRECGQHGIPLFFLDDRGDPSGSLVAPGLAATVETRRQQLLAYEDQRGVTLAKGFATGKILNQMTLLRYMGKYRKERDVDVYEQVQAVARTLSDRCAELEGLAGARIDDVRGSLLSIEGRAAEQYWLAMRALLLSDLDWPGREGRGAGDPVNMLLNYGYGILYGQVQQALLLAGLDVYGGFTHADRPGKASLVLDLIEEFRQMVVDRTVFAGLNKGTLPHLDDEGKLALDTRRNLAERIFERLNTPELYRGKRLKLRSILVGQARHVAAFLRGGGQVSYEPYVGRW